MKRRPAHGFTAAALVGAAMLAVPGVAPAAVTDGGRSIAHRCSGATGLPGDAAGKRRFRRAMRCLVNTVREDHGRPRLGASSRLYMPARRHSYDMRRRHYFAHVSPDGRGVVQRVRTTSYLRGAVRWSLGETLAWGSGSDATPEGLLGSLLASPRHRAVLLDPVFDDIGVGLALGAPRRGAAGRAVTITLVLGRRARAS